MRTKACHNWITESKLQSVWYAWSIWPLRSPRWQADRKDPKIALYSCIFVVSHVTWDIHDSNDSLWPHISASSSSLWSGLSSKSRSGRFVWTLTKLCQQHIPFLVQGEPGVADMTSNDFLQLLCFQLKALQLNCQGYVVWHSLKETRGLWHMELHECWMSCASRRGKESYHVLGVANNIKVDWLSQLYSWQIQTGLISTSTAPLQCSILYSSCYTRNVHFISRLVWSDPVVCQFERVSAARMDV